MNDCGCCDRGTPVSPRTIFNRPALSALKYRVGTFSSFRRAMIDSIATEPALKMWTSRDTDDYGIEIIELWAYLGDVLTFYQERIANEAFLRTTVQRDSLMRLAALIDYKLAPGVAATAYLAFTLERQRSLQIPAGLRVQSQPAAGQSPATFETEGAIAARTGLNALKPRLTLPGSLRADATQVRLKGMKTGLKPGAVLLFINASQWDWRRITSVTPDPAANETQVTWTTGLSWRVLQPAIQPVPSGSTVYALRQRAAIFGYNAPAWHTLSDAMKVDYLGLTDPRELTSEDKIEYPLFEIRAPTTEPGTPVTRTSFHEPKAVADAFDAAIKTAALGAAKDATLSAAAIPGALGIAASKVVPEVFKHLGDLGGVAFGSIIGPLNTLINAITTVFSNRMSDAEAKAKGASDQVQSWLDNPPW